MSTAAAHPGGFVVITEISPKTNQGDPSQTGQTAAPTSNKHLQKFYKGEPKALGVSQILNGITQIGFGIVCDLASEKFRHFTLKLFLTSVPYWSGLLYIISGSLSVAAANKPRISLIRGSLVMNIISAVASGLAVIVYSVYIVRDQGRGYGYRYMSCDYNYKYQQETPEESEKCKMWAQVYVVYWAILFLLLIMSVLELCVSISVAAFGCKTVCWTARSEVSVVIYQTTAPSPAHQPHPDVSAALTSQPPISEILPP